MKIMGVFCLIISFIVLAIEFVDWITTSTHGSIGVGSSTYASANFLMSVAFAALAIAFFTGSSLDQGKKVKMGEASKVCPFCAEIVKKDAKVCRYCTREFTVEANEYKPVYRKS